MVFRKKRSYRRGRKFFVPRSVKRYVSKAIDRSIEDKIQYSSLVTDFSSVGNAWIERSMNQIQQGNEMWNRIGRSIKVKAIEMKGIIAQGSAESATDDAYNVMRVVIGLYNNKSLTPLASGGATLDIPISQRLVSNGQLLRKYMDKYIPLEVSSTEQGEGDGYTPSLRSFKYYKRFKKPIYITYNGTQTTDANKYLMIAMLSDSAGIPNPGVINGWWKLTFEDA